MKTLTVTAITLLLASGLISCDSNVRQEDLRGGEVDSLTNLMIQHQDKLDELTSSLELNVEKLDSKLNSGSNETAD